MQPDGPRPVAPGSALDRARARDAAARSRLYYRDDWAVIEITGELDIQSVPGIRRLCLCAGARLLFDLRGVTFVDCGGLRAITDSAAVGGTGCVVVCARNGRARALLDLVGAGPGLTYYESVDEAVRGRYWALTRDRGPR